MSLYTDGLDALVAAVGAAVGVPATRDPSAVPGLVSGPSGGCALVGMPSHVDRLMAGPNLTVPVSLLAAAPSDIRAVDWLLEHMDALLVLVGSSNVQNEPYELGSNTYPAITATAQIALQVP